MSADKSSALMTSAIALMSPWRGWSPSERAMRRPMRAPDGHGGGGVSAADVASEIEGGPVAGADASAAAAAGTVDASAEAAAGDAADAGAGDEGDANADEAAAAAAAAGETDGDKFELEIDGKVEELSAADVVELIKQARAGNVGEEQIEAIRGEVEDQKRELVAGNTKFVEEVAQASITRLNYLSSLVDALCPQKPDIALLRSDPDSYHEQVAVFELFNNVRSELVSEARKAHAVAGQAGEQRAEMSVADQKQFVEREQTALLNAMPELREPGKATAFLKDASTYIQSIGYTAEDLGQITDHRLFRVLKDAMAYRAGESKAATIRKKLADKPPVHRGPGGQFTGLNPKAAELEQRVKAGHTSVRDVAALIDAS